MNSLKLFLALLLLLCLAPMPYGYYQFVRFVAMVIFILCAYQYYNKGWMKVAVMYGALTLLFQPFIKVALGRAMWNIVDVAVAIVVFVLWLRE